LKLFLFGDRLPSIDVNSFENFGTGTLLCKKIAYTYFSLC
jgi:hypothetical protein